MSNHDDLDNFLNSLEKPLLLTYAHRLEGQYEFLKIVMNLVWYMTMSYSLIVPLMFSSWAKKLVSSAFLIALLLYGFAFISLMRLLQENVFLKKKIEYIIDQKNKTEEDLKKIEEEEKKKIEQSIKEHNQFIISVRNERLAQKYGRR
ncbi:hypothetical protein P4H65_24095 [Paenibacillus chitinolyticus]|uniref:hypothetical protein n=1 Tax=Paenibacillus chitinolyticus TaxID=79263 RepID=UPI002DBBADAE|nr:hypothetical protein [Paenibacillus chitinolyticus]MEC0248879.1 hypothetical protein [Paenibacillus chitinolyticus]